MEETSTTIAALRRLLLALVAIGTAGILLDLTLLGHFEGPWQILPLVLLGAGLAVTAWHWFQPTAATLRIFRATMFSLAAAGALGMYLHLDGNREFQLEINPAIAGWPLFLKVIQAHSPPALAPASLVQLALLGLVYSFRHPALRRPAA